jgi:predicted RNA binding protein YcfA (HicA-like mRNA interferase family)
MSETPRLSAKEIIAALSKAGFSVARVKGSHHFLKHPDGRKTVVPVHSGGDNRARAAAQDPAGL